MHSSNVSIDTSSSPIATHTAASVIDVLAEILEWSMERPVWQRDSLRRLLVAGAISATDIQELTELCKSAYGLSEAKAFEPLTKEHLAIKGQQTAAVSITGVTHHCGVNALASEQTVTFGPNLTIVFGWNAAGKSGYARILKRACRSRGVENILGNVLSQEAPLKPNVTIRYGEGTAQVPLDWTPETPSSEALARVGVFDAHSAPVYLRDKTDVAFRPYGLDIFDKLSSICGEVRTRLQDEQNKLSKAVPVLPRFPEGTRAKTMVDSLTGLTNVQEVRALATLSPEDTRRLNELRDRRRDFQSADPQQRARELRSKSERISSVANHLEQVVSILDATRMAALRTASDDVRAAREAVALLQKAALTPDLLPGTGGETWKRMWESAAEFSRVAKPGTAFPPEDGPCPFCQQPIGPNAAARLQHFAEYVSSETQATLKNAESRFKSCLSQMTGAVIERNDIKLALDELSGDDPELAERIRQFLAEGLRVQNAVRNGTKDPPSLPSAAPITELRAAAMSLQARAAQLGTAGIFDPKLAQEVAELESRLLLSEQLGVVLGEIERKQRLAAYRQCIDETSTQQITRKSTDLTKALVTDQLRSTFQDELRKLEFKHLAIEIEAAGGARGALFHHLVFPTAPGILVMDVLSEGECRTLSLAAFLTELSTSPSQSAIILTTPSPPSTISGESESADDLSPRRKFGK